MIGKTVIKASGAFLALVLFFSAVSLRPAAGAEPPEPSAGRLSELISEEKSLKQQEKELNSRINSVEYEVASASAKKELLDERITVTGIQAENTAEAIAAYEELIAEKEAAVGELERLESLSLELYRTRIRAMEENGTISYYATILSAESFIDMLARIDEVNAIMEYDREVYEDLAASKMATDAARDELEDAKLLLEEKRTELAVTLTELERRNAEAQQLIEKLKSDGEAYTSYMAEVEACEKDVEKLVKDAEDRLRKEEADKALANSTGSLRWPVAGTSFRITDSYGWRTHPITGKLNLHGGLDIGAVGIGTDVLAADGGRVLLSDYNARYGNYLVIDHGDGMKTLYAHLNRRGVKAGDIVTQGQPIGLTGSSGSSTSPHLHFEVWVNGERADPAKFFADIY